MSPFLPSPADEFVALIVDSDSANRLILRGLLESQGGHVIEAENGLAASTVFSVCAPDLVVISSTPGLNGFETCAQIRALPNNVNIPVLVVLDLDDEATVNLALATGAADYVTTPIRPAVLRQRIRRLLQAHNVDVAIIQAKREWEAAFDAVSDMIILTDLRGKIIRCNLATIERLETTYAQVIGHDLKEILLQDSGQELHLSFRETRELQFPSLPGWFEVRTFPGHLESRWHSIVYILKDITERKYAEDALRASEEKYRSVYENVHDVIYSTDYHGTLTAISPSIEKHIGFRPEDLIGQSVQDFYAETEDYVALASAIEAHGVVNDFEGRFKRRDGGLIYVSITAHVIFDENGQPIGTEGVLRDISERRRAEERLSTSEARYRTLFEDAPVALWEEDFSGVKTFFDQLRREEQITDFRAYFARHPEAVADCASRVIVKDVNNAAMRLLGADTKEQLLGSLSLIIAPDTQSPFCEELIRIADGCTHYMFEGPNRALNGDIKHVRVLWSVWPGYEDTLSNVMVSVIDLTERKQAEESLRLSEERFQWVTYATNDAIWDLNLLTSERWWNRGISSLSGYTHDQIGKHEDWWKNQIHPDDRSKVITSFEEALIGDGQFWSKEYRFRRANGTYAYVFDRGYIMQDAHGKPVRVIGAMMDITDRKQSEDALRSREKQLEEAQHITRLGSWEWDFRTNTTSWSDELYRLCGWEPRSVPPSRDAFMALVHPADREMAMEIVGQTFQNYQPYDFDYRIISAKGETCWLHGQGKFVKDDLGQIIGFRGTAQDITERKQAEEALRASQKELSEALQIAKLGYWQYDVQSDVFIFNDHFYSIFHTTAEQEGGYSMSSAQYAQRFCHPDDCTVVRVEIEKALRSRERYYRTQLDHRILYADGSIGYISVRINIDRNEQGEILHFYGANQDVTERIQMEEALVKSEELFSKAFHASPSPMAISRLDDGVIIDANSSWERLFGFSRQAVVGQPILNLNIYARPEDRIAIVQRVREQGKLIDYELMARSASEEVLNLLMSTQIVEIQGQNCLLSTFYDITELRRMHEAMLASQKLADLGTLAAGVAHEMNSPLQVITGVSESLLRKLENGMVEPEQLRRNLDVIHRNGWRCAEIVRSLHTYARNSGSSMEPVALNELVSDALLLIEHQLKSWANISVHTILAEELPPLTCDHNQVTQVLINLLTNARDAMPNGGEITITTGYDLRSDELMLQISDTGIGIPDSIRSKIFDPFFTTKPLGKGTGLGLSIVDGIVRAHGGIIEVSVASPLGTTFTARFPAKPLKLPVSETGNTPGRFQDIPARLTSSNLIKELSNAQNPSG